MNTRRIFVTAAGTGVGKTVVTASVALAARSIGLRTRALKPVETGCDEGIAADALALARASGRPEDAALEGLHRVAPPLAPLAATLEGAPAPPALGALAATLEGAAASTELLLVEGAGGLLVPYDESRTFADLALAIEASLLVVLPNALGVLHDAAAVLEAAHRRRLDVAGVVLVDRPHPDLSARTNLRVLATTHPGLPLFAFPWTDEEASRRAAAAPILEHIMRDT